MKMSLNKLSIILVDKSFSNYDLRLTIIGISSLILSLI